MFALSSSGDANFQRQALHIANPKQRGVEMDTDDGWPKVWTEMTDEELLRHYLFLAANGPNQHAKRIAQLVAEADKRGKAEMVDEAMQWVKSHEPAKQE
jgi:hypothetical protein